MSWIREPGETEGTFETLALEVFRHQFSLNAPYGNYCRALGRSPENVNDWKQIPALPTDAFKISRHLPRSFPPENSTKYFLTSGTTTEIRGRHEFEDLELYKTSILSGWRNLALPEISNPWFLSQSAAVSQESSLVHMFDVLRLSAGARDDRWMIDQNGKIQPFELSDDQPVQLFSTAIGLLRWIESGDEVKLPEGSWVFETGGYKGLTDTLEPEIFRERLAAFLGIPESRILNEYSMTELSSQFYRWAGEAHHRGPHWTRVRVVDPETGLVARDGEIGYLEIVDLANLGSVSAIRTQDLAIARGDSGFVLLGRDPGALPRGCSRSVDDLLRKS